MKRLVIKSKAGSLYYNDDEHGVKLEPHEIGAHQRRLLLEKLHAYEETGLTPEQIRELKERDTAKPTRPIRDRSLYAICLNCGQTIFRDHRFCPDCGRRLEQ